MANTFTPEQISQILEEFFKVVGTRQYIGPRIVPLFGRKGEDSIEWDNSGAYEPLTVVLYQGNSFTSRQFVPVGVEITNAQYWAETGNFNGQVEQYRQTVLTFDGRITQNAEGIAEEIQNRTTADEEIERAYRAADAQLSGNISANYSILSNRIEGEQRARENAIAGVQQSVADEASTRNDADVSLSGRITANENDIDDVNERIDNLVIAGGGDSSAEVVDARHSDVTGVTYQSLAARLNAETFADASRKGALTGSLANYRYTGFWPLPYDLSSITDLPQGVTVGHGVFIVLGQTSNLSSTGGCRQILIDYQNNRMYQRWCSTTTSDFTQWKTINFTMYETTMTDLNDYKAAGFYSVPTNTSAIAHFPEDVVTSIPAVLIVFEGNQNQSNKSCGQLLIIPAVGTYYRFLYVDGNWAAWRYLSNSMPTSTADFDDRPAGNSFVGGNVSELSVPAGYPNQSAVSGYGMVSRFYTSYADNHIERLISAVSGREWVRRRDVNNVWSEWKLVGEQSQVLVAPTTFATEWSTDDSTTPISGTKLRLASYNVARFNNDTTSQPGFPSDVYLDKSNHFKRMLMHVDADVIGFQEFSWQIDGSDSTKLTYNYAMMPNYPFRANDEFNCIYAKTPITDVSQITVPNRPNFVMGKTTVDGKVIAIGSIHTTPGNTSAGVETRTTEIANALAQLKNMTADAYIMFGDFNSSMNADRSSLLSACETYEMTPCNGGYAGWIGTIPSGRIRGAEMNALDNILVSKNVIVNRFEVLMNWYTDLYSDHVPVFADVTILD